MLPIQNLIVQLQIISLYIISEKQQYQFTKIIKINKHLWHIAQIIREFKNAVEFVFM